MYDIKAYVASNIGKVHSNHEDNFLLSNGNYIDSAPQKELSLNKNNQLIGVYELKSDKNVLFSISDGLTDVVNNKEIEKELKNSSNI